MLPQYLQFGCGFSAPHEWVNFDASPTLRFERIPMLGRLYTRNSKRFPANVRFGDIVAGLPVPEAYFKGIYCSHILEHLSLQDCGVALANTRRYLRDDGIFRLVVPDLRNLATEYLHDPRPEASMEFMSKSCLGRTTRPRGVRGFFREWLGNSAHLWMWDEASMTMKLREHGFRQIRRVTFGDSDDAAFAAVEDKARFLNCLAMQACK